MPPGAGRIAQVELSADANSCRTLQPLLAPSGPAADASRWICDGTEHVWPAGARDPLAELEHPIQDVAGELRLGLLRTRMTSPQPVPDDRLVPEERGLDGT